MSRTLALMIRCSSRVSSPSNPLLLQQLPDSHAEGLSELMETTERWIMTAHLQAGQIGTADTRFLGKRLLCDAVSFSEEFEVHRKSLRRPWYLSGITMSTGYPRRQKPTRLGRFPIVAD